MILLIIIIITATTDVDFTSTSQDLVFSANLVTVCATIPIVDDQIPEPVETFQVQLISTSLSRALLGQSLATVIITDNDSMSPNLVPLIIQMYVAQVPDTCST